MLTHDPNEARESGIDPETGMQRKYVVLSQEELSKGYVRPLRGTYFHEPCQTNTTMSTAIAETYARDPYFYGGTFCVACKTHRPVGEDGEFLWVEGGALTDIRVGT